MVEALVVLTCIGSGMVSGIFFGFSSFIMKALSELPAAQGVLAMQRINVVVLNPRFLTLFMGTAVLGVACIILAFLSWSAPRSLLLLASGVFYVLGCFLVTVRFNVPLNKRLGQLNAESGDAAQYWPEYVRQWIWWNHVQTAASAASAVCSALALSQ